MKKLFPYYHNVVKFIGLEDKIYKSEEPINHIIDNLYLGDYRAADNIQFLKQKKISCIINCAFNLPNQFPKDFSYLNLNLEDKPTQDISKQVEEAYQFIKVNSNNNIFVHCVFGISRSSSVVIYYLMKEKKMSYDSATAFAREKRSIVNINPGFKRQLLIMEKTIKY